MIIFEKKLIFLIGNSEIDLPSLDPLKVDHVKVQQDVGIVTVRGSATKSLISGFSKGKIERFSGFDKNLLKVKIKAPLVSANGTYNAIARVLGIPINGNGKYKVNFRECLLLLYMNFNCSLLVASCRELFHKLKLN